MRLRSPLPRFTPAIRKLSTLLRRAWARRENLRNATALFTSMGTCRAALSEFGQESDREFTALAKGLAGLHGRLAELRDSASSLHTLLQDRDDDRAISSAYSLYKDSIDLLHASAGFSLTAQDQLSQVEKALVESCRDRNVFERDHLYLRFITLSIRIEASRLPPESQSVFLNVASAISETGEKIQTCTASAFIDIEAVISESRAVRAELTSTQRSLHDKARQSIENVQRGLAALRDALAPSIGHSDAITGLFASAQPQVMAVISALQHQDIVRQQLEHVCAGFEDIENHYASSRSQGGGVTVEWDYVVQASRIQRAQLDASREEIQNAGSSVVGGLQTLLETTAQMLDRFASMEAAGAEALDSCSIAQLFARELTTIGEIVEQSQNANTQTARILSKIERCVQLFSEEISRYELDVKIVALNAQIAAARLSSADALNRLAEETCHISEESARVTKRLSLDLQASLRQLDCAKRDDTEFLRIVTRERAAVASGIQGVTHKLSRLLERARSGASQARRDFAPLHEMLRELIGSLRFPTLIEHAFSPASELCEQLIAHADRSSNGADPSASALARIKQHESRYTMRKEANRHRAVLAGKDPIPVPASGPAGDVELFATAGQVASPHVHDADTAEQPHASAPASKRDNTFGDGIELF